MGNVNFSKFYELSDLMMLIINDKGEFLSVNDYFYKSTGFKEEDVIGHHFRDVLFEIDIDIALKEFQRVLSGEFTSSFILRLLKRNNKLIYVEFSAKIDFETNIVYAVGRDITGHLFNDSELQETALSVPGSIFKLRKELNGNFQFDYFNKNFQGLFENFKDTSFLHFIELLEEDSQIEFLNHLEKAQKDFRFTSFKTIFKAYPERIFQININPFRDKNEFVFYGIATQIDTDYNLKKSELREQIKIDKLKENFGYFKFKFDNYNINDDFESQKNAYLDGIVSDCNDLFALVNDKNKKEDLIGLKVGNILEDNSGIIKYLNEIIENNYSIFNKITYIKRNGLYVKTSISSLIKDGKLIEINGSFENITDSLLKQKQIEIAHQNYKNIFDFSPVGLMIHDENSILRANKVLLDYLETNERDFISKFPTHFVMEDSLPIVQEVIKNYEKENFVNEPVIIKVKTHKGNIKEFQATPHNIEFNGKNCIEVAFVDLTLMKNLQEENVTTKTLLESILDHTKDYIVRVNSLGIFTYCNKAYRDRIGRDIIGESFFLNLEEKEVKKLNKFVESILIDPNDKYNIILNKIDSKGNKFLVEWDFTVLYEGDELYIQCIGRDITELEETKSELLHSEEIYKLAANLGEIAYWEYYPDTEEVFWSEELYQMLGIEEIHQNNVDIVRNYTFEDELENAFKVLEQSKLEKKEQVYHQRFKNKDGDILKFQCKVKPIFKNDELQYYIGIVRNITELERTKEELEDNIEAYKITAQISKIAYWELDVNSSNVYWSEELYNNFGYENNLNVNVDFFKQICHPEDVENVFSKLEYANKNKCDVTYKLRMLNSNNEYRFVLANARPIFKNGVLVSYKGSIKDITEEEEKNQLIIKNQKINEATINALSEGVVLQDRDDKIIMHNRAAEKILGLTADQLIGVDSFDPRWKALDEKGEPLDGSKHPSVVTNRTGKPVKNFIMGVHKPDDSLVWILINSEPVSFNNDKIVDATVTSFNDITIMLKYQKEIANKESQFRSIFNYSPNGKFVCDSNNKIVILNKRAKELFDTENSSLVGKDYESIFIDEISENEELLKLINGESDYYELTRKAIDKNKNELILKITCTLIWDDDKQVKNILRIFNDITEVTNVNIELQEKNYLLNEMGYLSNTGAWEYYFDSAEFVWTDSIYDIYGIEIGQEIAGEIEDKYYHPDEVERVQADFEKLKLPNGSIDTTYKFIDAKGVNKIIRFKGKTISDKNNIPYKVVGILQDVTDVINREKEILDKNVNLTQLRNAINSSTIVSYSNVEGKIIEVNDNFVETYGYPREEIIGKNHRVLSSGHHSVEFWEEFWNTISNGKVWSGEIQNKSKDGNILWFNANIFPIKDTEGNILRFLEILNDITLNKNYQEKLENTVDERTLELREANNEKDFILQMVSHDLKNPLTGILLQSEIIKRYSTKNNDSYLLEKVNYLIDNTKRMNLIINNLLEFESVKIKQNNITSKFNLVPLISNIKSTYKDRLKIKNQELIVNIPDEEIFINSSKDYLYQVIDNLVSNASKFSNPGTTITLDVTTKDDKCIIKVKDEGPGISDEDKPKIFNKFVKLSNKPTGDENSSGLGLSIVKKLCDLLGHKITFESELNKGTIFSITIKV